MLNRSYFFVMFVVALLPHLARGQNAVFPENVEAVEKVEAAGRRGLIERIGFGELEIKFTVQGEQVIDLLDVAPAAAPAAEPPKDDQAAEAEAIAAHRAKAAAVRADAEAKAAKAAQVAADAQKFQKATAGLVEQVMGKFQLAPALPPRVPPAPIAMPAQGIVINGGNVIVHGAGQLQVQGWAFNGVVNGPVAIPVNVGDLNPQEQQMLAQVFQPQLDRELAFVRKACGLDEVQFKSLSEAAKTEVKSVVREYVKLQQQPRRVVMVNGVRRVEPAQVMPNKLMEKCLQATAGKVKLPEDKVAAYNQEVAKRAEFQKQAGIEAFVVAIDDRLFLDAEQRKKLTEALAKNWDENWTPYLQTLLYSQNFNPPVPNEILFPLLRQDQKDVWQSPNQGRQNMIFRGGVQLAPAAVFLIDQ